MESELHGGELEEGGEGCAHYPKGVPVMFREKVLFQRVTVLVSMLLFALSSFVGLCACSSAETAEYASIALDENTFEDEALRTYLSRHFDDNQNGVLDGGEAERIRELGCYELYTEGDPEYDRAREFPALFSLKGLELLPELSALRLSVENLTSIELPFMERLLTLELDGENYPEGQYLNSLDVSNCPMLQAIFLDSTGVPTVDLSGNRALTDISVLEPTNPSWFDNGAEQRIELSEDPTRIQRMTLVFSYPSAIESVDLSGCDELESLIVYGPVSNIELPATQSLRYLSVSSSSLASIDVTGTPAIQNLLLSGEYLSTVDLTNQNSLVYVDIHDTSVSNLNVAGSEASLRAIAVPRGCSVVGATVQPIEGTGFDLEEERSTRLFPRTWHRGDNGEE